MKLLATLGAVGLWARLREVAPRWIADLLPWRVVYWAYIRASDRFTYNDEEVPAVPYMAIVKRMGDQIGVGR